MAFEKLSAIAEKIPKEGEFLFLKSLLGIIILFIFFMVISSVLKNMEISPNENENEDE